jgi:tetratricopeptide (TPR) repeat protein
MKPRRHSRRLLRRLTLIAAACSVCITIGDPAWAQGDAATTEGATRRVRLQPVIRSSQEPVRLDPVIRAPAPAAATPAPSVTPAPAAQPTPLPRAVKQPPLGGPYKKDDRPPGSAVAARATQRIAAAQSLLENGEVNAARAELFNLAGEIRGTPEAAEALLTAAFALDDIQQTKNELREIVRAYPHESVGRIALARMGELNFILGNYDESIKAYRDFRKIAETDDQRRRADFRIALALLHSEKYEEAAKALDAVARDYPDLEASPELFEARGDANMALGNLREAEAAFQLLERDFPNYDSAVKVRMNRGLCAELLGDVGTAKREYALIIQEFPGSLEAGLAVQRLEDLDVPLIADAAE